MICYLTYGEYASGIYSSQVIDVCKEISFLSGNKIKLIALLPLKNFLEERDKIKSAYDSSIVLPMFPKLKYFSLNFFILFPFFLLFRPKALICRNAIPARLGLLLKKTRLVKKVVLDGRAAEFEQFKEYLLVNESSFLAKFKKIEMEAINNADYRIAVSKHLVDYWREKYSYTKQLHSIIPCTINSSYNLSVKSLRRCDLGYTESDIILIYSGSSAKWQSFDLLFAFLEDQLIHNKNIQVILLVKDSPSALTFSNKFQSRVKIIWCKETEVLNYLNVSDYGILLRENTWTNKVASPVKFAEYLNAGLNVIISPEVGDFSEFVKTNSCGSIYDKIYIELKQTKEDNRNSNRILVQKYFDKKSDFIREKYIDLLKNIEHVN